MKLYHKLHGVDRAKELWKAGYPQPEHFAEGQTWWSASNHKAIVVAIRERLWLYYYYSDGRYYKKTMIKEGMKPGNLAFFSPTEQEVSKWETSKGGAPKR
jgi:hypothetical protein